MKLHTTILAILTLLSFTSGAFADRPIWPQQPKISAAYESLTVALKQIEKSRAGDSAKHLANASAALVSARVDLDTAKKNKGSARLEAIKLIDLAKQELDAARLDTASGYVTEAMDQVTQAAKNGR